MIANVALLLAGLVVLTAGAEVLIRGSVRLARALGVSPFVIGFTLIGFGTSAPELVVCVSAAVNDKPAIALANVVGSNVANIGLILGLAAVVRPLVARMRLLRVEVPLVIAASLLVWFLCRDNVLSRTDGIVLLVGFLALAAYMYRTARDEPAVVKEEVSHEAAVGPARLWLAGVMVVVGLAGLVGGGHLTVSAAVGLAKAAGVSDWVIGLTVVAVGTSLPEVAAAVVAAYRGESDIALGNVAGSNLFNLLLILGVTVLVHPMKVSDGIILYDIPLMVLFAGLMLAVVANGMVVHRYEGVVLLVAYVGFVVWQVNRAAG